MSNDLQRARPAEPAPALYPPPAPRHVRYAIAGNLDFGWTGGNNRRAGQFAVSRIGFTGRQVALASWPLTQQGWEDAWEFMSTEHPELAAAVAQAWERTTVQRAALDRRAENKAALEAEGQLDLLAGCVLLGGHGFDDGVRPADKVDVHFTKQSIWITKTGGFKPHLRCDYQSARSLEFEGGVFRTGGGYAGGGFGVLGAAEGMAMAKLLNSLTTNTSINTTIRFEAQNAEVFLFTNQATPRNLEMRLSEVRGRIKALTPASSSSAGASGDAHGLADQLLRLGEMVDKGQLSADEFAIAKARLLGTSDR